MLLIAFGLLILLTREVSQSRSMAVVGSIGQIIDFRGGRALSGTARAGCVIPTRRPCFPSASRWDTLFFCWCFWGIWRGHTYAAASGEPLSTMRSHKLESIDKKDAKSVAHVREDARWRLSMRRGVRSDS